MFEATSVPAGRPAAQPASDVRVRLAALRQCHAYPHVVCSAGQWYPAERAMTGRAAAEWLDGGTSLAAAMLAIPGRVAVDLSAVPAAELPARLAARLASLDTTEFLRRSTLQLAAAQAFRHAEDPLLRRLPCHVVLGREDLIGSRERLAAWPVHWVPVFARSLAATARLVGTEPFATVSPANRLCLPADAAVLPVSVNLLPFWSRTGIDGRALEHALATVVTVSDGLIDEVRWPLASDLWDVYRHRRLALMPRGLGEIVQIAGVGAREAAARRLVTGVVADFQAAVRRHSRALAERCGAFAALEPEQALGHLRGRPDYTEWQRRWLTATRGQRFRHRNLTFVTVADFWPGQSVCARPAAWCGGPYAADGIGFGRRWGVIMQALRGKPAFGRLAAALTRDSVSSDQSA